MIAKLIELYEIKSKSGGISYDAFFQDEEENNYQSRITKDCRNFKRWNDIFSMFTKEHGLWLEGLTLQSKEFIDEDSEPRACLSPKENEKQGKLEF